MSDKPVLDQLNHLVSVNMDADSGLRSAAENVNNSEIQTLFQKYGDRHRVFASEIRDEIERLGEKPANEGGGPSLHRGWLDLKAMLTGHSVGAMLSACENAEQSAESAYLDALEVITSGKVHTLLQKHCTEIKEFKTHLGRLAGE